MVTNNSSDYSPTQYAVQIGGASGTLADVALGTATQVLTSNGPGMAPTFQAAGGGGGISTSFVALQSAAQSNVTGDGTSYFLTCDSVLSNVGGAYDGGTGYFTAPADGTYQFNVTIYLNFLGAAHTTGQAYIYNATTTTNLAILYFGNPFVASDSSQFVIKGSVIVPLSSADIVKPFVQVSGSTLTVQVYGAASTQETSFSGFRVS